MAAPVDIVRSQISQDGRDLLRDVHLRQRRARLEQAVREASERDGNGGRTNGPASARLLSGLERELFAVRRELRQLDQRRPSSPGGR